MPVLRGYLDPPKPASDGVPSLFMTLTLSNKSNIIKIINFLDFVMAIKLN